MKNILMVMFIALFASCGGNNAADTEEKRPASKSEALEMLSSVFTGGYTQKDIKEKMDAVFTLYKMPITGDDYLKAGNTLTSLRKSSANGVTEMDIIMHMILADTGWQGVTFDEQAGTSARTIEAKLADKK